jgi:endonuclease YncB( thermonuclease family)
MWASARARRGLVLGALALASLAPGAALAEVEGKPRILDGDSLEIAGQRFRLTGIEAPALDQVCHHAGQAYACGKVARAVLWDLVAGREVRCEPLADAGSGDIAATCKAGDTNLNEGMVAAGWALADRAAAQSTQSYGALEDDAKAARRGLWTGTFELPASGRPNTR